MTCLEFQQKIVKQELTVGNLQAFEHFRACGECCMWFLFCHLVTNNKMNPSLLDDKPPSA